MRKTITFLFAVTSFFASTAQLRVVQVADTYLPFDTMYVYILGGQSNMGGRVAQSFFTGNYTGTIGANGKRAFIKNYNINPGNIDTLVTGTNSSDNTAAAGVQPILGYELVNYKSRDIYFIQPALGGQIINAWNATSSIGAWMDSSISNMRKRADALGKKFVYKGFIWFQGESDGGDGTGIYQAKLEALIARVRTNTGVSNLPAVIVQMCDCQTGVTNLSLLQATQATVGAETNNYLISKTVGNTCQDVLHFDYSGQSAKAQAIFQLIKNF